MKRVSVKVTFDEYYTIGENYYTNGEYEKALMHFKKCISLDDYYNCLDYIGLCYLRLKKYELAAGAFKKIMDECQESAVPVINLGRVYLYEGRLADAFEMFTRAIQMDPFDEDAYFYLGVYYDRNKKYENSRICYEKSLKINAEQSETHLNLGNCYYHLNLKRKAMEEYDLAFIYDNDAVDSIRNKGITYAELGDDDNALNQFLSFNKHDPNNMDNIIDIAQCYYKINDYNNAYEWISKAVSVQPKNKLVNELYKKLLANRR